MENVGSICPLNYVKNDFYNKGLDLVVQVYVKEIDRNSLIVTFNENTLKLCFKTRSKEFLKLHSITSEETLFEWHVNLRHEINCNQCKYTLSESKLTLTLRKQKEVQWSSFEALSTKGGSNNASTKHNKAINCKEKDGRSPENVQNCRQQNTTEFSSRTNSNADCKTFNGSVVEEKSGAVGSSNFGAEKEDVSCSCSRVVNGECSPMDLSSGLDMDEVHKPIDNQAKNMISNGNSVVSGNCFHSNTCCSSGKSDERTKQDNSICDDSQSANQKKHSTTEPTVTIKSTSDAASGNVDYKHDVLSEENAVTSSSPKGTCSKEGRCSRNHCECNRLEEISPKESTASGNDISTNSLRQRNNEQNNEKRDKKGFELSCRPGSAGLVNYGNMCYINSVVQCLSALGELRAYLLDKKHCKDINSGSKNGFGGDLITCFGSIMQRLWSGKERCISATKLKEILGRKHKNFNHFGQGDAQEFLTFLLDGLHEDLKNENKEFIDEQETGCEKDIPENGPKFWRKFLNGNQSIIIDLFHGQTVFKTKCKGCSKPSIRFDPWMQLSLPVPDDPKYISIYVFFLDPASKPLQVQLKVLQGTLCAELLRQIGKLVNVPANHLVLIRPQYNRIAHIYDPTEDLSFCPIKDYLIACQLIKQEDDLEKEHECCSQDSVNPRIPVGSKLPKNENSHNITTKGRVLHISVIQRSTHRVIVKCASCSTETPRLKHCSRCFRVAYCNSECQKKHWKSHRPSCDFQPEVIGYPFILSIHSSEATLDELKKKALQYARFSVTCKKGELEITQFHLRLLENITDLHSRGSTLTQEGNSPVLNDNVCLALDWESATPDLKVRSKKLVCDDHESVSTKLPNEDKSCSLEECLKLYWKPDTIPEESGWRCDECKAVRPATREMLILRHPKNMIIHIKRFSYHGNGKKIRKVVRFPLRGLDMTPYTCNRTPGEAVYDLHAVCTHIGFMNFGHYVAYSKPYSLQDSDIDEVDASEGWLKYDDKKVSPVTENEVEKTEAYMLFYRRRDKDSASFDKPPQICDSITMSDTQESKTSRDSFIFDDTDRTMGLQTHEIENQPFSMAKGKNNSFKKCNCVDRDISSCCDKNSQGDDIPLEDELD